MLGLTEHFETRMEKHSSGEGVKKFFLFISIFWATELREGCPGNPAGLTGWSGGSAGQPSQVGVSRVTQPGVGLLGDLAG